VNQLVLVAVNFTSEARAVTLSHTNASGKTIKNLSLFLTNEFSNLTKQPFDVTPDNLVVPSQSVVTITAGFEKGPSGYSDIEKTDFDAILNPPGDEIVVRFSTGSLFQQVMLYGISGNLIGIREVESGQKEVVFPASDLTAGVYLVSGRGDRAAQTRKIIIAKR
jgi:hypothetical protein